MASRPEKSETDIRVTHEQLDEMLDNAEVRYFQPYETTLVGCYRFKNGWTATESAACVDPANFREDTGKDIIREKIKDQLWKLEGYLLNAKLGE